MSKEAKKAAPLGLPFNLMNLNASTKPLKESEPVGAPKTVVARKDRKRNCIARKKLNLESESREE